MSETSRDATGGPEPDLNVPALKPPRRGYALRFVLVTGICTIAFGAALGSWITLSHSKRHRSDVMRRPEKVRGWLVDKLSTELNLTAEQVESLKAVIESHQASMLKNRETHMAAMDTAIAALLTPSQTERWKELAAERDKHFPSGPGRGRGRGLGWGPGPRRHHPPEEAHPGDGDARQE